MFICWHPFHLLLYLQMGRYKKPNYSSSSSCSGEQSVTSPHSVTASESSSSGGEVAHSAASGDWNPLLCKWRLEVANVQFPPLNDPHNIDHHWHDVSVHHSVVNSNLYVLNLTVE